MLKSESLTMPRYLDKYAPGGRWYASSGRRYDLIIIDPDFKLLHGRQCAVAETEEAAAVLFGFSASKEKPRRQRIAPPPEPAKRIGADQRKLFENYVQVEALNISRMGAAQVIRWAAAGNEKAQAVERWINAHWSEYRTKQKLIESGRRVTFNPSSLWKPHCYETIAAEMMT